jgi:hypothetical protein
MGRSLLQPSTAGTSHRLSPNYPQRRHSAQRTSFIAASSACAITSRAGQFPDPDPYKAMSSGDHMAPAALFAFQNMGDFELQNPKQNLIDDQSWWSRREEPVLDKSLPDGLSGSVDIKQKSPAEPATGLRRALWPWTWFAVTGVVTLGWWIGICWTGFELARWLAG